MPRGIICGDLIDPSTSHEPSTGRFTSYNPPIESKMAARVLLQRRIAPLTATLLAGGVALYPRVTHAEAPELPSNKKPIYDDLDAVPTSATLAPAPASKPAPPALAPAGEAVIVKPRGPTPTDRLAVEIGRARLFLYKQACVAEDAVNSGMDKAFSLEQSFTSTLASLAPPRESGERLMPGLIYVLVAAMAGSIVTRNRNILLRGSVPVALGVGAAWAVIPVTMTNVSELLWKYEQKFPVVAEAHIRARESIQQGWSMAKVHTEVAGRTVNEKVGEARDTVEGWVRKGK
ncbi:hypothetical protein GQ53DRAFT_163485 [Thozetella sp. PMI_491]|nr:hypothetical protein GQ53DRAFT_163485 [Thozetella sp. PMI_491]